MTPKGKETESWLPTSVYWEQSSLQPKPHRHNREDQRSLSEIFYSEGQKRATDVSLVCNMSAMDFSFPFPLLL